MKFKTLIFKTLKFVVCTVNFNTELTRECVGSYAAETVTIKFT